MNPLSTREIVFIIVIVLLVFILGYSLTKLYTKRRNDIVKVQIKKDLLPPDGQGNGWIQGGACMMSDGSSGIVDGAYCKQTKVL